MKITYEVIMLRTFPCIFFTILSVFLTLASQSFCSKPVLQWNSENKYRLIVELQPDKVDRENFPVSVEVCFPKLFAELGINDQLDRNSIQVVAGGKVIPSRIF